MDKGAPEAHTGTVIEKQPDKISVELDWGCAGADCAGCGRTCATPAPRVVLLTPTAATASLSVGDRVAVRPPAGAASAALRLLCMPLAAFVIVAYLCSAAAGFSEGISALAALVASGLVYVVMNRICADSSRWHFLHRI